MHPIKHAAASSVASMIVFAVTRSLLGSMACLLSGIFMDVDHVFDFWMTKRKLLFTYRELDFFFTFVRDGKVFFWFHSFELTVLIWIGTFVVPGSYIFWGLAVGMSLHLLMDYFGNPLSPYAYFFIYRWKHRFDRKYVFKQGYFDGVI